MLAASRTEGDGFVIPQFALNRHDVEGFMDEFRGFHHAFRDCFARSEPREHFFHYMVGQFSELDRKSIEPMALRVEGGNGRARQRCLCDAVWDDGQLLRTYHQLVDENMGDPEGVVIVDESSLPKQGDHSIGVGRQYGGSLGKVDWHLQIRLGEKSLSYYGVPAE